MPKETEKILIQQFSVSAIEFTHDGKAQTLYFNYEEKQFAIKSRTFKTVISFHNYKDFFKSVTLFSKGEIQ